ncbi:MAG: UDP-N-acetylmuramoyl-tripeptide--D-alanyl-D-alanine ligase [Victivallaceae bacterium]|nr:UDP-N-acetylmuramoyl-tripeptide--D-alanyl-D-alanine ligase [Victivallaceae bacterium]
MKKKSSKSSIKMRKEMLFTFKEIAEATGGEWLADVGLTAGVDAVVTDSRKDCSHSLFLALAGENFDAHDFLDTAVAQNAAALCINRDAIGKAADLPEIPVIAVDDTLSAYQQLGAFHKRRFSRLKTIAVTGSMGKTSTKEIIRSILEAQFGSDAVYATGGNTNNQIGVPLNLLQLKKQHRASVIEIGTNHHGEVEPLSLISEPDVAVITTISACHLEFLGDLAGVATEKAKIFAGLKKEGMAVFPVSTPEMEIIQQATTGFAQLRFGNRASEAEVKVEYLNGNLHGSEIAVYLPGETEPFTLTWPLTGAHQAMNAAAAIAATMPLNIGKTAIVEGLTNCNLPGMRMKISEVNGVTWLNDTYNASPGSMLAVIEWLAEFAEPKNLCLVLGDMLELGRHSATAHHDILKSALTVLPGSTIFAVGQAMIKAGKILSTDEKKNISFYSEAVSAGRELKAQLKPGMMVLLKGSRGIQLEKIMKS